MKTRKNAVGSRISELLTERFNRMESYDRLLKKSSWTAAEYDLLTAQKQRINEINLELHRYLAPASL